MQYLLTEEELKALSYSRERNAVQNLLKYYILDSNLKACKLPTWDVKTMSKQDAFGKVRSVIAPVEKLTSCNGCPIKQLYVYAIVKMDFLNAEKVKANLCSDMEL